MRGKRFRVVEFRARGSDPQMNRASATPTIEEVLDRGNRLTQLEVEARRTVEGGGTPARSFATAVNGAVVEACRTDTPQGRDQNNGK